MYCWFSERVEPNPCMPLTRCKYERDASEKMTEGIIKIEEVMRVPIALGRMWRKIRRPSFAPRVRAAKMYSRSLNR